MLTGQIIYVTPTEEKLRKINFDLYFVNKISPHCGSSVLSH